MSLLSLHDPRAHRQRGQASVEWLAVVVVVATLLGLGAALAQAGYVGRRVTREMARAICLVGDGDCRRDQEPCVVGAQATKQGLTVQLLFFQLGEDKLGVIEERSDGTFAVTVEDGIKGGLTVTAGALAGFHVGKVGGAVGGEVTAALLARLGRGRIWIARSRAEANRLLETDGDGRPPDATSGSGTWTSSADAGVSAELAGQAVDVAQAGIAFDREAGWLVDQRTGHRTAYVEASSSASATAGGGVLGLSSADAQERYAVEYDASGRPVDLRVIATGPFGGSRDLPAVVQPVAGLLARGAADGGRGYEVTGHLDLTDAGNLAAARGLLNAIAARHATAAPAQALRRRIDERGTLQARVLAAQGEKTGASFAFTSGPGAFSANAEIEHTSQQLVAATSRGLDGQWITRTDCVA
jgi:hypothetical protein